jgi:cold shock protein
MIEPSKIRTAIVLEWHASLGWGILQSHDTPGGCWAHFSSIATDGYAELIQGERVNLIAEEADQDGYSYRAVRIFRTGDTTGPDSV